MTATPKDSPATTMREDLEHEAYQLGEIIKANNRALNSEDTPNADREGLQSQVGQRATARKKILRRLESPPE